MAQHGTNYRNVAELVDRSKLYSPMHANLHLIIGKASFPEDRLIENYAAVRDEIMRSKPSAAKGRYLRKIFLTTTMGPGIPVDPNVTRNFVDATAAEA